MESNDSPEIQDRRETSDIPGLSSGGGGIERSGKVEIRNKLLVVGEACMATLGFKGKTFGTPGFSTDGILISASAVPHCRCFFYIYGLNWENMLLEAVV